MPFTSPIQFIAFWPGIQQDIHKTTGFHLSAIIKAPLVLSSARNGFALFEPAFCFLCQLLQKGETQAHVIAITNRMMYLQTHRNFYAPVLLDELARRKDRRQICPRCINIEIEGSEFDPGNG